MVTRNYDWEGMAKRVLEIEKTSSIMNIPESSPIILYWKSQAYIGSVQETSPEYSTEIVLLSKSSKPIDTGLVRALKRLDKDRLELTADPELDLQGRQHLLRRLENTLTFMTKEQTEYSTLNLPPVIEI